MIGHAKRPDAFSLIELLIAILIISILVTIAVPNMMRARTRAKISAARAEMQMCANSLELYRLDNRYYPNDHENGSAFILTRRLTTPVRYAVGKQMDDAFKKKLKVSQIYPTGRRYRYVNYEVNIECAAGINWGQFPGPDNGDPSYRAPVPSETLSRHGMGIYGKWKISSCGPDQVSTESGFIEGETYYDPTNGIASSGDLVRSSVAAALPR